MRFLIIFLLVFLFTSLINLCNFADGMDGLLGGTTFVIFTTALITLTNQTNLLLLLGAVLSFLFWNWSPSKVFMGDSGSYFLGSTYFLILLNTNNLNQIICFLLIGTPIFADVTITILRRISISEPLERAHNLHLFQRLNQAGLSHDKVSFIYIFATLILSISYTFGGISTLIACFFVIILIGIYLDQKISIRFKQSLLISKNKQ